MFTLPAKSEHCSTTAAFCFGRVMWPSSSMHDEIAKIVPDSFVSLVSARARIKISISENSFPSEVTRARMTTVSYEAKVTLILPDLGCKLYRLNGLGVPLLLIFLWCFFIHLIGFVPFSLVIVGHNRLIMYLLIVVVVERLPVKNWIFASFEDFIFKNVWPHNKSWKSR